MRYSPFWRSAGACLVLLALAGPARGAGEVTPWSGGSSHVTQFEDSSSRIATDLTGRYVEVECVAPLTWRTLAAHYGFDRTSTWALTPLRRDGSAAVVPEARSLLSPRACVLAQAFSLAPTERGSRLCRHGDVLGECDNWATKLLAVHVVGHEAMHLAGVVDEASAECLSTQLGALIAARLGADDRFSRAMAAEYWHYYYRSQDARYRSAECRNGGTLDLFPGRAGWPTPLAYPPRVQGAIARFLTLEQAARAGP